jgi:G3E family GTPase
MQKAQQSPGWLKELRGEHTPETEEYGISSFVYRARRPLHPERFLSLIQSQTLVQVLRSKGYVWIASRVWRAGHWSKVGRYIALNAGPTWWAAVPRDDWPQTPEMSAYVDTHWDDAVGDCRQELVFIGVKMDQARITAALDECLLTDDEMAVGPEAWAQYPDSFNVW